MEELTGLAKSIISLAEHSRILGHILLDIGNLALRQQRLRTRPPKDLVELAHSHLEQQLPLEVPQVVPRLNLLPGRGHRGNHVPPARVPLNISAHQVVAGSQHLRVTRVPELKHSIHRGSNASKNNELATGGPQHPVDLLLLKGLCNKENFNIKGENKKEREKERGRGRETH